MVLRTAGGPIDDPLRLLFGAGGTRTLVLETGWDLSNLAAAATADADVTMLGAVRVDITDASPDGSRIPFARDYQV